MSPDTLLAGAWTSIGIFTAAALAVTGMTFQPGAVSADCMTVAEHVGR